MNRDRRIPGVILFYRDVDAAPLVVDLCLAIADYQAAFEHINPHNNPILPYGPTPLGTYTGTWIDTANNLEYPAHSYGTYGVINLLAISGQAKIACSPPNNRDGLLIHGGDINVNPATNPFWYAKGMRCTHGCVRITNAVMKQIQPLIINYGPASNPSPKPVSVPGLVTVLEALNDN